MYKLCSVIKLGLTALLVLVFTMASVSAQQGRKGSVRGTVTTATGTPTVSITVVLENIAGGAKRETLSDASGNYHFDDVEPGRYRMNTTINGVTSGPTGEVAITGGVATVANLTIATPSRTVSTVSPVTQVEEATQLQELTGPTIETSYNTRDIQFLPSPNYLARNGAYYGAYNLSLLSAGVASNGGIGTIGPVVGGQRPISNNYYIEGIDNTNHGIPGPRVNISNEATSEFISYQNQFPPEYGHTTGGQFNAMLRTGTNEVHGALYEYFQNRNLNAVDQAFANRGITDNPRYDQNRLGGNLGFPIIRDKVFFFGDFEFIPLGFANAPVSPMYGPTAAGYATLGSISGLSQTNLQVLQSTVPAASSASGFTTVRGTQVPIGAITTFGRSYQNQYNGVGAADWRIGQSDSLQARYTQNEVHSNNNGAALPVFVTPRQTRALLASLSEVHTFASGSVNELRLGYNRFEQTSALSAITFPGLNVSGFPYVGIQQDLNLQLGQGLLGPQNATLNTYNLADNFHWRAGRHNIRFGADVRRLNGPVDFSQYGAGTFTYSNLDGFLQNLQPDVAGQRTLGVVRYDTNQWDTYGYVKDEWRARPNLEIDLGLRYEFASLPSYLRRQSLNAIANVPGSLQFGVPGSQRTGFAPQVGLAFAPGKMRNSVFRFGFGMNYDASAYAALGPTFVSGLTTRFVTSGTIPIPGFFGSNGFFDPNLGSNLTPQARTTFYVPDQKLPYTIQWNAAWQQAIFHKFILEVRYLGVRGVHIPTTGVLNQTSVVSANNSLPLFFSAPSQATLNSLTTTLNSLQPINTLASAGFVNPIMTTSQSGNSWYNGLAVQGRQRFAGGFQMLAAYTWSHLIDDVNPPLLSPFPTYALLEQRTTRDSSPFDHRQRGTLTWLWDVGALGSGGFRWYRDIVANLTLASTYTYETPAPTTLLGGFDNGLTGGFYGAGVVVNPNGIAGTGGGVTPLRNSFGQIVAYQAINPNAQFIQAAPGLFANSARSNFNGLRPINNFDVSLAKRFAVPDKFDIEIRADAFNLINHPQFTAGELNNIGLSPASNTFLIPGTLDSVTSNPRSRAIRALCN